MSLPMKSPVGSGSPDVKGSPLTPPSMCSHRMTATPTANCRQEAQRLAAGLSLGPGSSAVKISQLPLKLTCSLGVPDGRFHRRSSCHLTSYSLTGSSKLSSATCARSENRNPLALCDMVKLSPSQA